MDATTRADPKHLIDFATAVYAGEGVPEADARLIADTLVQADLWGHQSHGLLRLGWYWERLRNGVMKPVTEPEFVVDAGTIAIIDGRDGVGHVLTRLAATEAIRRAKAHGIGFLSAVHSPYKTAEKSNCGHLMIALNIEAFQPLAQFNARMEQYIGEIKSVPRAQGFEEVFYPGEIEASNDLKNRREGLQYPEDTLADLARIARETGLESRFSIASSA